jgi:hypothetical protein
MDADIIAEFRGKVVPLAAGTGAIDDPVERLALVNPRAAHPRRRIIDSQNALHRLPKLVGHVPDRWKCFGLVGCAGDGRRFDYLWYRLAHAQSIGRKMLNLKE